MKWFVAALVALGVTAGVGAYVEDTKPGWYGKMRYPLAYEHVIVGHAENYDVDAALLAAMIYRESRFDPKARSSAGAIGLMQILPETAKGIALNTGGEKFVVQDLYDPEINVRYGAFYYKRLLGKYEDERLALAAYNAGQRNVDEWLEAERGIVFPETQEYVEEVVELRGVYERAYGEELGLASAN